MKKKEKKGERTGGVRAHGKVRDPTPDRTQHRSLRATGCLIGFAVYVPCAHAAMRTLYKSQHTHTLSPLFWSVAVQFYQAGKEGVVCIWAWLFSLAGPMICRVHFGPKINMPV
jgi:hypothetical protein